MVESRSNVGSMANHKRSVMNLENKIGDKDILNRKTKSNIKYSGVKATVNTNQGKGITSHSD
jgi:hypothetical protein